MCAHQLLLHVLHLLLNVLDVLHLLRGFGSVIVPGQHRYEPNEKKNKARRHVLGLRVARSLAVALAVTLALAIGPHGVTTLLGSRHRRRRRLAFDC